jgi:formylmethanofuran dehydrogenase subunit B
MPKKIDYEILWEALRSLLRGMYDTDENTCTKLPVSRVVQMMREMERGELPMIKWGWRKDPDWRGREGE